MPSPPHLAWLKKKAQAVQTIDGTPIEVWELQHQQDPAVLKAWAKHFREHYCADKDIETARQGTGLTKEQYLLKMKFPSTAGLGPAVRSGDFAEILVADYLEYVRDYWVPRTRWENKDVPDESKKGTDLIGFKFFQAGAISPKDVLFTFESKAQLSGDKMKAILQNAINDSVKDEFRKAHLLNAAKQRLLERGDAGGAAKIERFQNFADRPYLEACGAAALFTSDVFDATELAKADCSAHPKKGVLLLLVISGADLMDLVHGLYATAAREA